MDWTKFPMLKIVCILLGIGGIAVIMLGGFIVIITFRLFFSGGPPIVFAVVALLGRSWINYCICLYQESVSEAQRDRAVLAEFYETTGGANWAVNKKWNTDAPLNQWYGVHTNWEGRVTKLHLGDNQLSGSIPALLGGIRSSLRGLTNLKVLHLGGNQLSGSIPASLGRLTNLGSLWLHGNQLSGSIPAALCRFAGTINPQQDGVILPRAVSSESGNDRAVLAEFYEATGGANWAVNKKWNTDASLDRWYGVSTNRAGRVTLLILGGNQLSGSIPSSLGGLTNLRRLSLDGNQLSGSIPSSLGGLAYLEWLSLDGNQLSGSIPFSLGGLTYLETLSLHGNRLSGSIPAALCSFVGFINPQQGGLILSCAVSSGESGNDRAVLMEFYEATGGVNWAVNTNWNTDASLDQWYGVSTDTASRVTSLELGDNQLSGSIPAWLGCLTKLKILELGGNQLFGSIPSSLGDLTNLEVLELGWNQLSGSIPARLGDLTKLKILELGGNQLSGSIPARLVT